MKYLLTFVRDRDRMYEGTEENMKRGMEAWNAFNKEAIKAGVLIANEALESPKGAKTVLFAEDGSQAQIAELAPGTWYLAVEQRGPGLVAQTQDGRRGVLQDTSGIQRG